jgi:branched-chain amino acid aminotransferase
MTYLIVNGDFVLARDALISVEDRGFRYGDGVFETIAVHAGVAYQLPWHLARLSAGLAALRIVFDTTNLTKNVQDLLAKNKVSDGILRIQVTRGIGSKGYLPDPNHPKAGATWVLETAPLPAIIHQPVSLWLGSFQKISSSALPVQYKTCQSVNSILARLDATDHDCVDALMLNDKGIICETSSGNIFWIKDGTLYTSSLACGVLMGSTRHAIMRLSPYPVIEVEAPLAALLEADAIFMCNVVWPVIPVGLFQPINKSFNSTEMATQFRELLYNDRKFYSRKSAHA